jgi:hypothetical protein
MTLRAVVLTQGDARTSQALRALADARTTTLSVLQTGQHQLRYCMPHGGRVSSARLPIALARSAVRTARLVRRAPWSALRMSRWVVTGPVNSPEMLRDLRALDPDVVVLGGGMSILSREVLAIPRHGTINVHAGLVPWIRGNGAVVGAILRGVAVGVSVHYCTPLADAGPVIDRWLVPVERSDTSLDALSRATFRVMVEATVETIQTITRSAVVPAGVAQPHRFPICRRPDAAQSAEARALVRAGGAHRLFAAWRRHCEQDAHCPASGGRSAPLRFRLPRDMMELPGDLVSLASVGRMR